jgi:DNA-binding LacI/PurR family transcriptional regulator
MHRRLETYMTPVAQIENVCSAYEATRLLLKSGVKNPVCISHYYSQVSQERELGFCQALEEAGFNDAKNRIYRLHPSGQTVDIRQIQEVEALMRTNADVDGLFSVAVDMLAIVLQVMKQTSYWEEAAIVSFDFNHEFFRHKGIVAMLDTPAVEMGSQAAHYLLRSINSQTLHRMQTSIYPQFHVKKAWAHTLDERGYLIQNHVRIHG